MASFLQPIVYDPNAPIPAPQAATTTGRFLVYRNPTLIGSGILANWYQYVVLGLAVAAVGFPLFRLLVRGTFSVFRMRKKKHYVKVETTAGEGKKRPNSSIQSSPLPSDVYADTSPVKSFGLYLRGDVREFLQTNYDLHMIDLNSYVKESAGLALNHNTKTLRPADFKAPLVLGKGKNVWALLEESAWKTFLSTVDPLAQSIAKLKLVINEKNLSGLVISSNILSPSKLNAILHHLFAAGVQCMLLDDAENPSNEFELELLQGVIYSNACILPNGKRRDFFQASKLRTSLSRYHAIRKRNPNFLVGFLDRWETRPLPSVIRRAYKLAKFNGAIYHHGPLNGKFQQITDISAIPSSAFDWLKRDEIIAAQKRWSSTLKPVAVSNDASFTDDTASSLIAVENVLPGIQNAFKLFPTVDHDGYSGADEYFLEAPAYVSQAPLRSDFWTKSSQDKPLSQYGCFGIKEDLYEEQYDAVVSTQIHLQTLGLLQPVSEEDVKCLCDLVTKSSLSLSVFDRNLLQDLCIGLQAQAIRILRGLDSGFCLPDGGGHFWAVSNLGDSGNLTIFVSQKTPDLFGAVMHEYLARRNVKRYDRFSIESSVMHASQRSPVLHPRIAHELQIASYAEILHILEQLTVSNSTDPISELIRQACEHLLIEEASNRAWIKVNSQDYLARDITLEALLKLRLDQLAKKGSSLLPSLENLLEAFIKIDTAILSALYESDIKMLGILSSPILMAYGGNRVGFSDIFDLYSLLFFSSLKRHAYEEVFLETTDRCPLFIRQQDQAGVFAELWVLGSQCEIYFGIKPRALGSIIYEEYREYIRQSPPPAKAWNGIDVFTAYHAIQANDVMSTTLESEVEDNAGQSLPPRGGSSKLTYLAVFCVPAIVDVGLLTFLGRGLYLTAFMTLEERVMANYAVLSALLIAAGVTGWSGSTGGYYLYQSAFHNMNHFMVQRFSGGIMLASVLAICGLIIFGFEYSWYAGFVYFAYLMVLSPYLNLLGIMCTMHLDAGPFRSGRTVLARCLLISLISPIISSFVSGHDIVIYLAVLYSFLAILIKSYSTLCYEWSNWPEKVHLVNKEDIVAWYEKNNIQKTKDVDKQLLDQESKTRATLAAGSSSLLASKLSLWMWTLTKATAKSDAFIKRVAEGHPYIVWLLEKESNGQPLPPAYTTPWLVQAKLALTEQLQKNRGLKEHSSFLLFRNAKYDLAQNIGLFLVALLDRWVAVSMSANGYVVNLYDNPRARYGIAFGLLYFLFSAVSLDIVVQRYWGETGRRSSEKLGNIFDFDATETQEASVEKRRWLKAISELVWLMITIFGVLTTLLWLFVGDPDQIVLYFAYIVGYSGVIIFQFNRVFTTDITVHVKIVFLAAFGGYVVGIIFHQIPETQSFKFNDVIALCSASLSAAVGTWLFTDFCDDASREVNVANEDLVNWKTHSQKLLGRSELNCAMKPEQLTKLQGIECRYGDGSKLSEGIKAVFDKALANKDSPLKNDFPTATEMLEYSVGIWKVEQLRLFLLDRNSLADAGGSEVFAASVKLNGTLEVYLGLPAKDKINDITDSTYEQMVIQLASEAILHEACEAMMELSHSDAVLAELLLNGKSQISTRMAAQLSQAEYGELASIISQTNVELERHLALGINVDVDWENTPEDVRIAVISRVAGRRYSRSEALSKLMLNTSSSILHHDWYIKQCLGIHSVALHRIALITSHDTTKEERNFQGYAWSGSKINNSSKLNGVGHLKRVIREIYNAFYNFFEFVAIVSAAGPDCGRELWFVLRKSRLRTLILWLVLKIWKVCWWVENLLIRAILLEADPNYKQFSRWTTKGVTSTLKGGVLSLIDPRLLRTGFLATTSVGYELTIYEGSHRETPVQPKDHQLATYDENMRLLRLVNARVAPGQNSEVYHYQYSSTDFHRKYPLSRRVLQGKDDLFIYYDNAGLVTNGQCIKEGTQYKFAYEYLASSKGSPTILRATYTSVDSQFPIIYTVYWCRKPPNCDDEDVQKWTPTSRATHLIKLTEYHVKEYNFRYEHKRDPIVTKTTFSRDSRKIEDIRTLEKFSDDLRLLEKPTMTHFRDENLLFDYSKRVVAQAAAERTRRQIILSHSQPSIIARLSIWIYSLRMRKHVVQRKLPTSILRTELWRQWCSRTDMAAVTTCFLDEIILRREPSLSKYWSWRDAGYFRKAKGYLAKHLEEIIASIEISDEISAKANLAIKTADLFVMGLSKDSNYIISEPELTYIDTEDRAAVMFTDTGCWPDAPGGVSNCRRDIVDGCRTIRFYALTESANEYGTPRFQMEKNLQLVKNLPLWGLDGKTPYHGLLDNMLQTQVESRIRRTRNKEDIIDQFIPLLTAVIRGARTIRLSRQDILNYTSTFLNINRYFEENDYITTWRSKFVRKAWREAWLCEYTDDNILNPNDNLEIEKPTNKDFDQALELYISYFFIFSIRVPKEVPRVYQSTHHGISSLFGMILKLRRGTTWGIWDHAIMWRESCLNISPAQCLLPIAVQSMLLGAMSLAANLAYFHADIILPCTAIYNPDWEAEIGTDQGRRSSHKSFLRKVDPITNGISNMDSFKPVEVTRSTEPTTIMLSNVQFIKDVKNAIMAAGIIINDFGFKKYNLIVYGAQDRQPSYAIETEELINNLGIQEKVKLGGFGSPKEVLKDAWLFMNSSLSEGLPLAIGEAALSGIPIVATEVGATAQVLTDVDNPDVRYGEVVPPNDPLALARAQISLLAMLGPWTKYTVDETEPPPLPIDFTAQDVEWITERMYAKTADRKVLGLKLRDVVQRKFNGARYLREHEQMFWIQLHRSKQRAHNSLEHLTDDGSRPENIKIPRAIEIENSESMWMEDCWQEF